MWGKIVIVERGDCMFVEKGRVLQSLGAVGGIVMDNTEGTAAATSPLFAMSGDGVDDVQIPMVFLFMEEAKLLMKILAGEKELRVTLEEKPESSDSGNYKAPHLTSPNLSITRNYSRLSSSVSAFDWTLKMFTY